MPLNKQGWLGFSILFEYKQMERGPKLMLKHLQDCVKTGKTVELKSPQSSRHWTKLFLLFQSIQRSDYSLIVVINPFVSLSE